LFGGGALIAGFGILVAVWLLRAFAARSPVPAS
jgi:hypothetical protein